MNNRRGFTMIEVAMVMVILGVMAALALIKYTKTVASNEIEQAANNLYLELRGLRPIAFKYDGKVSVRFNTVAMQCTVWVDTSAGSTPELKRIEIYQIPTTVKIGRSPTSPPTAEPFSMLESPYNGNWCWPNGNLSIVNGLQGGWKDYLDVTNDSRGEYDHGGIYLYHPRFDNFTYFIGITGEMQSIELKKWNGVDGTWSTL